jgi:excisionase family DNA binding protein
MPHVTSATRPIPKTESVDLDALLTPEEAAAWLRLSRRILMANIRQKKIPAIQINERVFRIHPRSVLVAKGVKL